MNFIVDGTSLRGSALARAHTEAGLDYQIVESDDRRAFHGRSCETMFFMNANCNSWQAEEDPSSDFRRTLHYLNYHLHEIRWSTFVLLSDSSVYGDSTDTDEDRALPLTAPSTFAFHRRVAEEMVRQFAPNHLIVRIPRLVYSGSSGQPRLETGSQDGTTSFAASTPLNLLRTDLLSENVLRLLDAGQQGTFNLSATESISAADARDAGLAIEVDRDLQLGQAHVLMSTRRAAPFCRLESSAQALASYRESDAA